METNKRMIRTAWCLNTPGPTACKTACCSTASAGPVLIYIGRVLPPRPFVRILVTGIPHPYLKFGSDCVRRHFFGNLANAARMLRASAGSRERLSAEAQNILLLPRHREPFTQGTHPSRMRPLARAHPGRGWRPHMLKMPLAPDVLNRPDAILPQVLTATNLMKVWSSLKPLSHTGREFDEPSLRPMHRLHPIIEGSFDQLGKSDVQELVHRLQRGHDVDERSIQPTLPFA